MINQKKTPKNNIELDIESSDINIVFNSISMKSKRLIHPSIHIFLGFVLPAFHTIFFNPLPDNKF